MDDRNNNSNPPSDMAPPDGEPENDAEIGAAQVDAPEAADSAEADAASQLSPPDGGEQEGAAGEGDELGDMAEASEEEREMAKMLSETGDDDDEAPSEDKSDMLSQASIDAALQGLAAGGDDVVDEPMVRQADFQQLSVGETDKPTPNIDLLMDVELPVSIELGRTRMNVADILVLGPGSVVELDKLVGEPVDLLVNQKIVARGEVVVVDENFGLRITQLVSPEERVKNLQ
ncbi:MAG: flagellar motor switch protein FliN [candidate division Zixibacteria bacterium]|nr:flagellar motor switch protein FliN [candidate division Zixibacteria bacterium]